eukprot:gnl/TRDRNA2_/TRDRNA2_141468_c1_seq1.p1 gnl/TRDRNA2_/TRDRNA2_141468_c1~~gnl/TRDRNA2_/TRDRNA2_141468_c1_seq1.p1  ORF type:complete len:190 (+),score=30.67 gnl/TRDRNA2_/TRDRNA2_141468_c1_seq1:108-677(+)
MTLQCGPVIASPHETELPEQIPLLCPSAGASANGCTVAEATDLRAEQERAVANAVLLLQEQLSVLNTAGLNRTETSDLLRDTCQSLSDLVTGLERCWADAHPGQPQPSWPLEVIPEEELARIGWDFHSNRVQILNTGGSFWESIAYLLKGNQQANFAKPPSSTMVMEALARAAERLKAEVSPGSGAGGV